MEPFFETVSHHVAIHLTASGVLVLQADITTPALNARVILIFNLFFYF